MKRCTTSILTMLLVLSVLLLFALNLTLGSIDIPLRSVIHILSGTEQENEIWRTILLKSRLPQALTSVVAGAGLAVSGLMMQTVFRNPLAGPSVLGISSGASLGVAFVILLSGSIGGVALSKLGIIGEITVTLSAICGSLLVMALIAYISLKIKGTVSLLIMGVMIGYIATAVIGVLKFFSSEEDIRAYVIWGLGSFSRVSGNQTYVFVTLMLLTTPFTCLLSKTLNLLLLGDSYARNLGLNIKRARLTVITYAGILVAVVTAYCGPIVFLGLAVPHICRGLYRTSNHSTLIPASLLTGASLALACNIIARLPGFEGALPVNSVTALVGAPVVIWVLFNKKKAAI